ncbi:hypothetical protein Drose_04445 [Dactylosporangium roseum]|uniref:Uncharacterized protein n=1 Tax=Dactylosporangium roseum TaxID=47989 RepID=A0ABY5Z671_9ACTN|nr:hypothetical protein [Dactylosporangium roseum]UWZ37539.1 hypothetical protein Drose_04445 [Dactylosporangium roseum]
MSADLLRRAAAKLREHARAASFSDDGWAVDLADSEVTTADGGMMIADTGELTEGRPDASYIALMHPPVALALADWLDAQAQDIANAVFAWQREEEFINKTFGGIGAYTERMFAASIAVARSILREPEETPDAR